MFVVSFGFDGRRSRSCLLIFEVVDDRANLEYDPCLISIQEPQVRYFHVGNICHGIKQVDCMPFTLIEVAVRLAREESKIRYIDKAYFGEDR